MSDILDRVLLTQVAVVAYRLFAERVAREIKDSGLNLGEIPDEQAREDDEGGLVIYVDLPRIGTVEFTVPKGQWAWKDLN